MFEVRSAIHLRTGQRAVVEAIDAWLMQHQVEVISFADVYEACVYVLSRYDRIPDLALIGADWLSEDEFDIVPYLRQTWPRVGVVVYGGARDTPRLGLFPLTITCRSEAALRRLLAESPADLVRKLCQDVTPNVVASAVPRPPSPSVTRETEGPPPLRLAERELQPPHGQNTPDEHPDTAAPKPGLRLSETETPRSILTAEELSALLDPSDEA